MWSRGNRSTRLAYWTALVLGGCATPTALPPAAVMLGAWSYASAPIGDHAPSLNTGLHVTVTVDAVEGASFSGQVSRWIAGDVGIAPDQFGPVTGRVDDAGRVTFFIPQATSGPILAIRGSLNGDVLTVHESWSGAEPGPFPSGGTFRRSP
jgi:hypothetical protein